MLNCGLSLEQQEASELRRAAPEVSDSRVDSSGSAGDLARLSLVVKAGDRVGEPAACACGTRGSSAEVSPSPKGAVAGAARRIIR